jgi:hypothetical protein
MFFTDVGTHLGDHIGVSETERGVRVSPETIRRVACDALLSRVIVDADGVVLDHGLAKRTFTPAQFRALVAQYTHCTFPGCEVPSAECQMHHIDPAEHGGPTDMINGAPGCYGHHKYAHEGGWTLRRDEHGAISWYKPDGTLFGTTYPRRRPEPNPTSSFQNTASRFTTRNTHPKLRSDTCLFTTFNRGSLEGCCGRWPLIESVWS